jgi:hypothetical protein
MIYTKQLFRKIDWCFYIIMSDAEELLPVHAVNSNSICKAYCKYWASVIAIMLLRGVSYTGCIVSLKRNVVLESASESSDWMTYDIVFGTFLELCTFVDLVTYLSTQLCIEAIFAKRVAHSSPRMTEHTMFMYWTFVNIVAVIVSSVALMIVPYSYTVFLSVTLSSVFVPSSSALLLLAITGLCTIVSVCTGSILSAIASLYVQ